jgi:hypothetical protein
MRRWGLDPDGNAGQFNEAQSGYLAFHRANIFKSTEAIDDILKVGGMH